MEQKQQITLESLYHRIILLEKALKSKGITIEKEESQMDDEGELTDEFKERLEKARKTPISEYVSHEEVKRRILAKKK
ncbi:hypothetical protein J4423_05325 [Candidatus Pacearchaeota archaeon]|nr:hypothetical protein [Candidatus Pacearchaeota archaeon]